MTSPNRWFKSRFFSAARRITPGVAVLAACLAVVQVFLFVGQAEAQRKDGDDLILCDFSDSPVGGLPRDWTWKKADNDKNKPYKIVEEADGNRYLAADDNGESVILGYEVKWNLREYPYLEFRWRARELPAGGDERYGDKNDSAAGLYMTYNKKTGMIPVSAKFVWSSTLEVGAATRRSGVGRPFNVVVDSGDEYLNEWRTHVVDLREVFEKTFGGKPPKTPVGIGVLTDANSVGGTAAADYDYIKAVKNATPTVSITKVLKAE